MRLGGTRSPTKGKLAEAWRLPSGGARGFVHVLPRRADPLLSADDRGRGLRRRRRARRPLVHGRDHRHRLQRVDWRRAARRGQCPRGTCVSWSPPSGPLSAACRDARGAPRRRRRGRGNHGGRQPAPRPAEACAGPPGRRWRPSWRSAPAGPSPRRRHRAARGSIGLAARPIARAHRSPRPHPRRSRRRRRHRRRLQHADRRHAVRPRDRPRELRHRPHRTDSDRRRHRHADRTDLPLEARSTMSRASDGLAVRAARLRGHRLARGPGRRGLHRGLRFGERFFARILAPRWARAGLGGLLVGVIAIRLPEVCGNGYERVGPSSTSVSRSRRLLLLFAASVLATVFLGDLGQPGRRLSRRRCSWAPPSGD